MPGTVNASNWEKHIQTITTATILAVILWGGNSISKQGEITARMDERMIAVQSTMLLMQRQLTDATKDRYTATQAQNHREIMINRINTQERRIGVLERKYERISVEHEGFKK